MKTVCGLVFALCLATSLPAEENAPLDYKLRKAVEDGRVGVPEAIRQLKAALPSLGLRSPQALYFAEVYAAATRRAQGAEQADLENLLRKMPAGSLWFGKCFSAYATDKVRRQVAQRRAMPVQLKWVPASEELPKELVDAPVSFRDAWRIHRTVVAPYLAVVTPPEKANATRRKLPELAVDLRKVIGDPEPGAWQSLSGHVWGSWCGTGSDSLYHPRNRALLISFLADGKLQEAAGAALSQVGDSFPVSDEQPSEPWLADLLTALGLDWEQVMFGSLLPVRAYYGDNHRPVVSSGFTECDAWHLLAARGSAKVVRQCLDLIHWAKLDPRSAGEFLAVALGPEPVKPSGVTFSSRTYSVRGTALTPESRREVLAVFAEYLAPENQSADLIAAMDAIPSPNIPDLRAPLAALVSHPFHPVATKAYRLLQKAGLTDGQEKIVPAMAPLNFRLLVNGEPLRGAKVSLEAVAKDAPKANESTSARAIVPSQDLTTNKNGGLAYSMDQALEPDRLGAVLLRIGPPLYSSVSDDDQKRPPAMKSPSREPENIWPGPWIVHRERASAGDTQVHEIPLRVADLEVKLAASDTIDPKIPVKIMLRRAPVQTIFSPERGVAKVTGQAGSSAFFRRLQPGKYTVLVKAPTAARYDSGEITVGDTAAVHEVKLTPGRNVRGTVINPDGTKSSLVLSARLFRGDSEIPREDLAEWKGLRFGKYTVRLELPRPRDGATKAGDPANRIANEDRSDPREFNFVIDASTPATLDLGEMVLPDEAR